MIPYNVCDGTIEYIIYHGMIRYDTVRYGTPSYDKVCHDMVSFFRYVGQNRFTA
jgi:hypothetical protein